MRTRKAARALPAGTRRTTGADAGEFLVERIADVGHEVPGPGRQSKLAERQRIVKLRTDRVRREIIEMLVPFGQTRIKDRRVGQLHQICPFNKT